ncbi:hypothetical protein H0H93_014092 [Arthromyces matolae]|nr:hypothetical protein H0H93_014092 [Arthromyces matolae]
MSVHSDTPPFTELDSPRIRSSPSVIPIPVRSWEGRELISVSEVMLVKIWDYTVSVVDTLNRGSYLWPLLQPGSQIDGMKSHISNGRIKPSCIKSLFKLFVVPSEMDGLDIEDLTVRLVLELHRWLLALNNSDDHEATQKPKHIRGALTNGSQWIFVILSESPSTTTSPPSTPSPTTYTYKETIKFDPFRSGVRDYPFPSDTPFEEKVDSIAAILRSWIVHCFEDLCDDDLVMVPTPRRRENVGSFGGLKSKT